jgi:hypothetical protein
MNYFLIDNFFGNVDSIRDLALSMTYNKSSNNTGWKGYRTQLNDSKIDDYIKSKLSVIDKKFENLIISGLYFHYSLEETKKEMKDFSKSRLHKDLTQLAGVIYLTPYPEKNSGTTLHFDNGDEKIFENVYNRFILYEGSITHGAQDTFGDSIKNGRLTMTFFAGLSKNDKTLF